MDRHGVTAAIGDTRIYAKLHEALAATQGSSMGQIPESE
jgi:hypothetical protein